MKTGSTGNPWNEWKSEGGVIRGDHWCFRVDSKEKPFQEADKKKSWEPAKMVAPLNVPVNVWEWDPAERSGRGRSDAVRHSGHAGTADA
jgi:hypothetical protein